MKNNEAEIATTISEICTSCGMCCDGTLFGKAKIKDSAEEINAKKSGLETIKGEQDKLYFKLPCAHFNGCCTIYDKDRPHVCGGYFCLPLKKVQKGTLSIGAAKEKIEQTLALRAELLAAAAEISIFKDYTISTLLEEIQPKPTNLIKEHRTLWLKMIGFLAACTQISGSEKGKIDTII
jgi:hypothetical protein